MAHDVAGAEVHEAETVDPGEHPLEAEQAALAVGDVDLRGVAGDDDLRAEADAGEEHLHLLGRGVLRLVEDDEAVVQRAAAHERERRDLDGLAFEQLLRALGLDHVVERVVQRAQVRIDLGHQVAGQEAEALTGLDGRTGEDDPLHLLGLQRLDGHRHRQPALAGAGRAEAEGDHVVAGWRRCSASGPPSSAGPARPLRAAHDVVGQHRARPLVLADHVDRTREAGVVEVLAALDAAATSSSISRPAASASGPSRWISLPRTISRAAGNACSI